MPTSRPKTEKRLDWSKRALADRERIARFYNAEASLYIARAADAAIVAAAQAARRHPQQYREGKKPGTREYVMRRFPYIVIYRLTPTKVRIVRVLHQAAGYFN